MNEQSVLFVIFVLGFRGLCCFSYTFLEDLPSTFQEVFLSCEEHVGKVGGVVLCTACLSELPSLLPCVPHPVDRSKWPALVTQPHKLTSHPFEVSALEPCEAPICHQSQPAHCLVKHPRRIS